MIRGEYGWDVWGGELSDPSAVFFLQRCLGGGGGGKKSATQRRVDWRYCCQSTVGTNAPR